jgi:hypothetical protein
LRLAIEDDLRCGELPFSGGFRQGAGAAVLTIVAVSPPRGASVLPPPIEQRRLPTTISLSKLNHAALVLAVYASQLSFPLLAVVRPRKTRFRLVASLYRAGVTTPQGPK